MNAKQSTAFRRPASQSHIKINRGRPAMLKRAASVVQTAGQLHFPAVIMDKAAAGEVELAVSDS